MAKSRLAQLHVALNQPTTREAPTAPKKPREGLVPSAPHGERGDYLSVTIRLPADMLKAIKDLGVERKAAGIPGTTASAIIREAVAEMLEK